MPRQINLLLTVYRRFAGSRLLSLLPVMALAVVVAAPAFAAPPPKDTTHNATSATLRDAQGDVLRSDGNPVYSGREVSSTRITDRADPSTSDYFQFQSWERTTRIQSPYPNDGQGVDAVCDWDYVVFTSKTTPDWYNTLTQDPSAVVIGDAGFLCSESTSFKPEWKVSYPDGNQECARISRTANGEWRFTAPAYAASVNPLLGPAEGCPATITKTTKEKGQTSSSETAAVSAPFEITVVIP